MSRMSFSSFLPSARRHGPRAFTCPQLLATRAGRLFSLILIVFVLGTSIVLYDSISEHVEHMLPMSMCGWCIQHGETPPEVQSVNLLDVPSLRMHEARLPQHNERNARVGRFVRFQSQHHWGIGFNNMWQEFILLATIAEKSNRSYVFRDLVFADQSTSPFTGILAGPVAGSPRDRKDNAPLAVSNDWYAKVACPRDKIIHIDANKVWEGLAIPKKATGKELVEVWATLLNDMPDRCVDVEGHERDNGGRGFFSLDFWYSSPWRATAAWPMLSKSPIITQHAWSDCVYAAVTRNLPLVTNKRFTKDNEIMPGGIMNPPRPLGHHAELSNVLSMHIRRGDYERHCLFLESLDAPYAVYNVLPGIPDTYTPNPTNWTTKKLIMPHCIPTVQQVIQRVTGVKKDYEKQNPGKFTLDSVFLMTNADEEWLEELKAGLREVELENVVTSRQLDLRKYEKVAGMVVDMEIGIRSALFIGNGFSTLTSTVVALRDARGAPRQNSRMW